MADVDVMHTVSETKKTRKIKKTTKRRESADQGSEITITEIEQTTTDNKDEGYVMNSIHPFTICHGLHSSPFGSYCISDFVIIWPIEVH